MNRILNLFVALILCFMLCIRVNCAELEEYKEKVYSELEESELYGITPDNMSEISVNSLFDRIGEIVSQAIKAPIKIIGITAVFAIISRVIETVSNSKPYYQDICVIALFVSISPYILRSFEELISAMNSSQGFLAAYVPTFASIISASGNLSAALSYNSILLYASEGAVLAVTVLIKPMLGLMLVSSVINAVNPEMPNLASSLRRISVTLIGFIMSIFLGVIGLHSVVGRAQDSLTVKAGKYLVASFVPIIGGSLNESYRTVKASLDSIRSVVGSFGIVIIVMIFIAPILTAWVYRLCLLLCEFLCGVLSNGRIGMLIRGIGEVYTLLGTVVTIYMLMLIIATGALIALGGGLNI